MECSLREGLLSIIIPQERYTLVTGASTTRNGAFIWCCAMSNPRCTYRNSGRCLWINFRTDSATSARRHRANKTQMGASATVVRALRRGRAWTDPETRAKWQIVTAATRMGTVAIAGAVLMAISCAEGLPLDRGLPCTAAQKAQRAPVLLAGHFPCQWCRQVLLQGFSLLTPFRTWRATALTHRHIRTIFTVTLSRETYESQFQRSSPEWVPPRFRTPSAKF